MQVYSRVNPAKASVMAKGQLFQAHLYLEAALPGRATGMPPALLRACREVPMHTQLHQHGTFVTTAGWAHVCKVGVQAWLGTKSDITVSMFQWSVLAIARFAGFDVKPEYDDGFFSVDMAVFLPGTPPVKVGTAVVPVPVCRCWYGLQKQTNWAPSWQGLWLGGRACLNTDAPAQVAIEVDGIEHYTYNRTEVGGVEQYRFGARSCSLSQHWSVCSLLSLLACCAGRRDAPFSGISCCGREAGQCATSLGLSGTL